MPTRTRLHAMDTSSSKFNRPTQQCRTNSPTQHTTQGGTAVARHLISSNRAALRHHHQLPAHSSYPPQLGHSHLRHCEFHAHSPRHYGGSGGLSGGGGEGEAVCDKLELVPVVLG